MITNSKLETSKCLDGINGSLWWEAYLLGMLKVKGSARFGLWMIVAIGIGVGMFEIFPAMSQLKVERDGVHFPTVSGNNLDRQALVFPRDFEGELNLLFVAFWQRQQLDVNTWLPFAEGVEAEYPAVVYYELPTIQEMPMLRRTFINEGMRAGIPSPKARERTVTLYLDKRAFVEAAGIETQDEIAVLLVNREGEIVWRTMGRFEEEKGVEVRAVIEEFQR